MNSIPGEYLSADVGAADLMGVAEKYPTLFWTGLIVLIIVCVGYGIYYFIRKKAKN